MRKIVSVDVFYFVQDSLSNLMSYSLKLENQIIPLKDVLVTVIVFVSGCIKLITWTLSYSESKYK